MILGWAKNKSSCDLLFLTNEFLPIGGGIATYSFELSKALNELGHKTVVVAARRSAQNVAFDQQLEFRVVRAEEYKIGLFRHLHRLYISLKEALNCRPHFLLASDWRPSLVTLVVAKVLGIPFAVSAYGTEILMAGERWYSRLLASYVFKNARVVLSISNYTKELLCKFGVDSSKIEVITLGVDPHAWHTTDEEVAELKNRYGLQGKQVILTLARLTARKGHEVVIRALPSIIDAHPNAVYVIAGKGENETYLRCLVNQLGLEDKVVFTGFVPEEDKAAMYSASDVYVLLSRREGNLVEGFGLTLLEAGACGVPVVAGRHGGVCDAVIDGETGYLIDPLQVDEAVETITYLLQNPQIAKQLGTNARTWIKNESNWSSVAVKTWAVISRKDNK